jgi:hypothetical protein
MTRFSFALAAALLSAPIAGPAPAQQPPATPSPAPAARPWQADWGQYYCSLIRKPEAGRPFATAFVMIPGMAGMHIALIPEGGAPAPTGVDGVALLPAGTSFAVTASEEIQDRLVVQRLYGLSLGFDDLLAGATALELRSGGRTRARVPLDGVRSALAAHRRCMDEVAREWGLDQVALAALSRRPNSNNGLGLGVSDYPDAALRRATQGRIVLRIAINARGRATACTPVATSGSPQIDVTTCRIALRRGRFDPALDAAGRPVAVQAVFLVRLHPPPG